MLRHPPYCQPEVAAPMLILLFSKHCLTANIIRCTCLPFYVRFFFFFNTRKVPPAKKSNSAVTPADRLPGELLLQLEGLLCESILAPVEMYLFLQVASSEETPVLNSNRLIVPLPSSSASPSRRRKKIERQVRQRRAGSAESLILPGAT